MLWLHTPERFSRHAGSAVTLMIYDAPCAMLLRDNGGQAYLSLFAASEEHEQGETHTWLSIPVNEEDARRLCDDADMTVSYAEIANRAQGNFLIHELRWSFTSVPRPEGDTVVTERELAAHEVPAEMLPEDWPEQDLPGTQHQDAHRP